MGEAIPLYGLPFLLAPLESEEGNGGSLVRFFFLFVTKIICREFPVRHIPG